MNSPKTQMKHWKQTLKFLLKSSLGVCLVVWVLRGKMVDFSLVKHLIFSPANLILAIVFLSSSALLCTARWLILARAQGLTLSFSDLFSLTMIGNFFNTFMPGSVGGDLIKAWYIAGKEPQRRTQAVFTVLLDRLLGLSIIIFYSAFTLLIFSEWMIGRTEIRAIALGVWLFTVFALLSTVLFFLSGAMKLSIFNPFLTFLRRSKKIEKIIDATCLYRSQHKQLFFAAVLSALSILSSIYFHLIQGNLLGIPLSWQQYFFVVPLAVTASAIPLLPGGIGTGQVAFYTLFKWMGVATPELGGTLCTLVQIYSILFNCLGYFFYLRFKRMPLAQQLPETMVLNEGYP